MKFRLSLANLMLLVTVFCVVAGVCVDSVGRYDTSDSIVLFGISYRAYRIILLLCAWEPPAIAATAGLLYAWHRVQSRRSAQ
jgi:hypothetical protein